MKAACVEDLSQVESEGVVVSGKVVEPLFERRHCPDGGFVTYLYCENCPKQTNCRVWKDLSGKQGKLA